MFSSPAGSQGKLVRVIGFVVVLQILLLGTLAFLRVPNALASPYFSYTMLTWNSIGLDSNKVTDGPNQFPVGWRVCNTSGTAQSNVQTTFTWGTNPNPNYIDLSGNSTISIGTLASGACQDVYYTVTIMRSSSAYGFTRPYTITASSSTITTDSGISRTLRVESLISQNRNGTYNVTGPTNVTVGQIVTYTVQAFTATNGYLSWESYLNFPPSAFQILSTTLTYPKPSVTTVQQLWDNNCAWNEITLKCANSNNGGGDPDWVTYTVRILNAPGTYALNNLVYDLTSDNNNTNYHYNSDYATPRITITVTTPTAVNLVAFKARAVKKGVSVKWTTGTELNMVGFNVWRKIGKGEWKIINPEMIASKNIETPYYGATYKFLDKSAKPGKVYQYKLEIITASGSSDWSDVVRVK